MRSLLIVLFVCIAAASSAWAGETLEQGPPPAWVRPIEVVSPIAGDDDDVAAFRVELMDQQVRLEGGVNQTYVRTQWRVLSPQALPMLGSVVIPWNPANQTVSIHGLRIFRGDRVIDALEDREFTILRREQNLEAAMLNGVLTATLQLDDLRVGDVLELEATTRSENAVLGRHAEILATANLPAPISHYHLRASWPRGEHFRIRATDGWDTPAVRRSGGDDGIEIVLKDLEPLLVPDDAPTRFHHVRQLEVTDYGAWSDVADVFLPLYARASELEAGSPIYARAAEIREATDDPRARAEAALRLVQDEVRYLALSMGDGGLVPASADETWRRRLGDCKGKTALLLALLKELQIPARAVLVATRDDALERRLPLVGVFDHVMVEAVIDGRSYWLDGTRSGDRKLEDLTPPAFGWVLPLTTDATLTHIDEAPPARPRREFDLRFDASAGLYVPAPTTAVLLQRGDLATELQTLFGLASAAQRDAYMRQTWTSLIDDLEIDSVASSYDRDKNEFRMTMSGETRLDWTSAGGQRLEIPLSSINWSAGDRREAGPYQDLPRVVNFPAFTRFRTQIVLPPDEAFTLAGQDVAAEAARYSHIRRTQQVGGTVVMEREFRALASEMTEAERAAAEAPLKALERNRAEIVAPRDYLTTDEDRENLAVNSDQSAAELVQRGLALQANGQVEDAIAAFDAAIAKAPRDANALANRGIVRFWDGDIENAKADFEAAAVLDPNERIARNGLGLVAMHEQRFQDAAQIFSDLIESWDEDQFALAMRASAYMNMKSYDQALADIRAIKTLNPTDVDVQVQEVAVLVTLNRLEEASTTLDALVQREPTNPTVLRLVASVRDEMADYPAAEAALTTILETDPDHGPVRLSRADARAKAGDLDGARADMALVRPTAERSVSLLNNLCWLQAVSGFDLAQALADCDAGLALSPESAALLDSRGLVLLQLDRPEDALAAYDAALKAQPEQPSSLYGRGLALRALDRATEGQAEIDKALSLDPRAARPYAAYEARHPRGSSAD